MPQDDLPLLERGVYRSACLGPSGETILFAVDHNHRLLRREFHGMVYVLPGDNPLPARDRLRELLNRVDPVAAIVARSVALLLLAVAF